jgi:hypothetical protein
MRNVVSLLVLFVIACSNSTGADDTRTTADLHFLRPAAAAPPLATSSVTFTATRGQNSEATIYYAPRPGEAEPEKFLEFKIPNDGLAQRPDGTPITQGQSVQITITVIDPSKLIVEFQPSGLRFTPDKPAELRIHFAETDDDLDDDGDVDLNDAVLEAQLSLWRQEQAGQPWTKLGSLVVHDLEEVRGELSGFTNYVVAY